MITKPWNKNYPKQVPLSINIPNITLKICSKAPIKISLIMMQLVCHSEKITFSDVDNYANKFAGFLQNQLAAAKK